MTITEHSNALIIDVCIYIYDACNSFCDCEHMYIRCTHRKSRAQGNVNMLLVMPKVNTCVLKSAVSGERWTQSVEIQLAVYFSYTQTLEIDPAAGDSCP